MLKALDENNNRAFAWIASRKSSNFYCPDCKSEVTLKKGPLRLHHFAHKPHSKCKNYTKESREHYECKREIYTYLNDHCSTKECDIECQIGSHKADIFAIINNIPVVIEIQKSAISVDDIIRRINFYHERKIRILWVIPHIKNILKRYNVKHKRDFYYPKTWQLYLQQLYYGKLYIWSHNFYLSPIHLDKFRHYIKEGNWIKENAVHLSDTKWYEDNVDKAQYGGYLKISQTQHVLLRSNDLLSIIDNFKPHIRKNGTFKKNIIIPESSLWIDKKRKWW